MELLVPLMYVAAFAIAYYGPNSTNMGNIGRSFWHFEKVDDIFAYLTGALEMALADLVQSIVGFLLVRKFTRINVVNKCK